MFEPSGERSRSCLAWKALAARGARRIIQRQTNGKAERFIRTLLGGWAYGALYGSSAERARALDGWLWNYNHRRPHGSLSHKTPAARLTELNNLARPYRGHITSTTTRPSAMVAHADFRSAIMES